MLVGRRDDPHIHLYRPARTDAADLAIFDRPQKPILGRARERRELVEEQRAAIGLLETTGAHLGRSGKGSRLMAEKLGFDQGLRKGSAIERDERRVPS
jgi:hypothetical protein